MVRGFVSFTPLPGTAVGTRVPGFFLLPALGAILFVSKRKNCPCNSFFVKGKRKGRSKNASPAAFFDLPFRTLTKIFLLIKWIVLGGKKRIAPLVQAETTSTFGGATRFHPERGHSPPLHTALPSPAHVYKNPGAAVLQFRGFIFICNETRKTSLTVWPSALRGNILLHFLCRRAYRSSNKQMPD